MMAKLRPSRHRAPYAYGPNDESTIFIVEPDEPEPELEEESLDFEIIEEDD